MQLEPISQSFSVAYSYKLHFTRQLFAKENSLLHTLLEASGYQRPVKFITIIDDGVHSHHPHLKDQIKEYAQEHAESMALQDQILVPGGENVKNTDQWVHKILDSINTNNICRHSFVLVIGGGAVIDMAGYAAAIAHRGVRLIRIPTTVLSQNDAAVGIKNGINEFDKKNFIGTFSPPFAIINDVEFLSTLEDRDWRAGIAEAIKVSLLKDKDFFSWIEENIAGLNARDESTMQHLIYKCAALHMHHIAKGGDPFELGSSRPLDFGHWSAHKLEQMTKYTLRHGEAVAMGIALDVVYAERLGILAATHSQRVIKLFTQLGFDLELPIKSAEELAVLLEGIQEFREHLGGKLTITLISDIGIAHDVHEINREEMKEAINRQKGRSNQSVA
ncbi:MAG: 3-dehydroquinate synthase [Flavobacteriaceae bacterium]|nr:3-dehydroquinate synthase [Flavobacteriaceae bacterium]